MDTLTTPLAVLGLMVAILGWFLKREIESNRVKHEKHFDHAVNLNMHENDREREAKTLEMMALSQRLNRHEDVDDKRFARLETTLDVMQKDIKDILKVVSQRGSE